MEKNNQLNKAIVNEVFENASNIVENKIIKVKLNEFHSKTYLKKLSETTDFKDKEVVFILPNGKEYKNERKGN